MNLTQSELPQLSGYDYSKGRLHFVTLCTQNREPLFGTVVNGTLTLNQAGKMIAENVREFSQYNGTIAVDTFIIMPNHLHAILLISPKEECVRPSDEDNGVNATAQGALPTIADYIRDFKTFTTKNYIDGVYKGTYPPFDKRIWQKSFNNHVIRSEKEYQTIGRSIHNNPLNWTQDTFYQF